MKQNLLLIEDVDSLGRSGDVVSVKPGYARNFLLPQKKAVIAQKHTLRMQERLKEERAKKAAVDKQESEELAKILEGRTVTIEVKIDPEGHLYGSVSAADVAAIFEKDGIVLEKKFVQLPRPIKELGTFPITLKLKEGVPANITLIVMGEGGVMAKKKEEKAAIAEVAEEKAEKASEMKEMEEQAEEAKEE